MKTPTIIADHSELYSPLLADKLTGTPTNLNRKSVFLGSILSAHGASGNPGAIH